MNTEKLVKTIPIDKAHRIAIWDYFHQGNWKTYAYLEERFLWWWYKIDRVTDNIQDRAYGFTSLEKALDCAERYLTNYKSN